MKCKTGPLSIVGMVFCLIIALGGCKEQVVNSSHCGDEVIDVKEECDGVNLARASCQSLGYHEGTLSCDDTCHFITSSCGGTCGDGMLNGDEECDGNDLDDATCETLGYYGGNLSCGDNCKYDKLECVSQGRCGDNVAQSAHEECDGQDMLGYTCEEKGYGGGGNLSCTTGCLLDYGGCIGAPFCGDLIAQGEEECDNTDYSNASCYSLGYYGGSLSCTGDCEYDVTDCMSHGICGDGVVQSSHGETCDGTDFDGDSCVSLGYYGGNLECSSTCQVSSDQCVIHGRCGDGIIQDDWYNETCDGTVLGFASDLCSDTFWYGSTVGCDGECQYDLDGCNWFTQIDAGNSHNCGIDRHGTVHCMGRNAKGQLGLGEADYHGEYPPRTVHLLEHLDMVQISAGYEHTCAVDSSGAGWCWGTNTAGRLGAGSTVALSGTPLQVLMPAGIALSSISAGANFSSTCGLDTTGAAWCWGPGEGLGDTVNLESATPVQVVMPPLVSFSMITCGSDHCCSLDTTGDAWCWGDGGFGQLGTGGTTDASAPVQVLPPSVGEWTSISAGNRYTCAVNTTGEVYCWGMGEIQLGMGEGMTDVVVPTPILPTGATFTHVAASISSNPFTCATDTNGKAWCWGHNFKGNLGDGSEVNTGTPVQSYSAPHDYLPGSISLGFYHTIGLTLYNKPYCFGDNGDGQCGLGWLSQIPIPMAVPQPM